MEESLAMGRQPHQRCLTLAVVEPDIVLMVCSNSKSFDTLGMKNVVSLCEQELSDFRDGE